MAINKVVFGNSTIMDITDTTATESNVIENEVFYKANGEKAVGTLGVVTYERNGLMSTIDKIKLDALNIEYKTTAEWNLNPSYIPAAGAIIIYSDKTVNNGINIAGMKVGDGQAYVADLPFTDNAQLDLINSELLAHITDSEKHITAAERSHWNAKLNYDLKDEELIFNRG